MAIAVGGWMHKFGGNGSMDNTAVQCPLKAEWIHMTQGAWAGVVSAVTKYLKSYGRN